jgi:hypothetical protein
VAGSLTGDWGDGLLCLAWIDGAGRVVSHIELARAKQGPRGAPLPFALDLKGGLGRQHRLAALVAPRPGKGQEPQGWRVAAETSFRVVPAFRPWLDYVVFAPASPELAGLDARGVAADAAGPEEGKPPALRSGSAPWLALCASRLPAAAHPLKALDEKSGRQQAWRFLADRKPVPRVPGYFDEAAWGNYRRDLEAAARAGRPFGPVAWSLGHDLTVGAGALAFDLEPDAATLDLFRAWLRQRYGELPKLNAQWGTDFARWDEVRPPTTDECKAQNSARYAEWLELLQKGDPEKKLPRREERPYFEVKLSELPAPGGENFSGWCEYHEFLDFVFARLLGEARAELRRHEPGARAGLTGGEGPSPWGGYDWGRLARALDWAAPPDTGPAAALFRSFSTGAAGAPPAVAPAGTRAGAPVAALQPTPALLTLVEGSPAGLQRRLWEGWFDGSVGAVIARYEVPPPAPKLKAAPAWTPGAQFRELAGGVTLQRSLARPRTEGIALYYSPRSLAVKWMLDSQLEGSDWARPVEKPAAAEPYTPWLKLLHDLGYTPSFVSEEQLLAGGCRAKVLILPKVLSLSPGEAEALREFALFGGVVLADSECGTFDGAGRRRPLPPRGGEAGVLDADFGLLRQDLWTHELGGRFHGDSQARVILEDPFKPVTIGPSSSELRVAEPGVRATSAWHYGRTSSGAQAVLSRSGGAGRFVYLNLALQDYSERRLKGETDFSFSGTEAEGYARTFGRPAGGEALRVLLGDMLDEALGGPRVEVRSAAGVPWRNVRRARWQDGTVELLALLPGEALAAAQDARVVFDRRAHWHDVLRGAYLGLGTACQARLEPDRATVLAPLPYRVKQMRVKARRLDPHGTFTLDVELETSRDGAEGKADPGRHVFHVEVLSPSGAALPYYEQNVVAERGAWSGTVTLGLNEPAGLYRWTVRDVLTGTRAEAHLVKGAACYADLFPPPRGTEAAPSAPTPAASQKP